MGMTRNEISAVRNSRYWKERQGPQWDLGDKAQSAQIERDTL